MAKIKLTKIEASEEQINSVLEEPLEEPKIEAISITSEEITVVATKYDLNFGLVKFKKDMPLNYTRAAFDELTKSVPNIQHYIDLGDLKIV